eukprot:TRINITY_DN73496_c0_g1_i1.p1 TRINITY_DN73496_c0_g1~~TRINITY_DN73496_c0_g1_i1.p1  ORF type:complete len:299 (+),score=64.70 TRINITY_DN73496_c0_g1_i1:80-976(+)
MAEAGGQTVEASSADALEGSRRRGRQHAGSKDVEETIDELAMETKRTTLLDRLESQLKTTNHVSRLLFAFSIADDKKIQKALDQEFTSWKQQQEGHEALTGVLVLVSAQTGFHLLEGPTEIVLKALSFFHSISTEAKSLRELAGTVQATPRPDEKGELPALLSTVRVLHFTELHGVQVARSWCSLVHPGKSLGGVQTALDDTNSHELVFSAYKKMLCLCLKVQKLLDPDEAVDSRGLKKAYEKAADEMPTVDEVQCIMGKNALECFFTYPEFEKVFILPFQLVLHSELLWPMPPALSY